MLRTASPTARLSLLCALAVVAGTAIALGGSTPANAIADPVGLGGATGFAVLAYSTVTSTGPTVISGDIGLHPGSAVVGFPPGTQLAGSAYVADSVSLQARNDAIAAFTTASAQPGPVSIGAELGGLTLTPDLYQSASILQVNGTLTLDGLGDPSAVFVFRSASALDTGSASEVLLINDANPCNVFWIVPSSATLGTGSTLVGTVIASTSITATTGASVDGRLLALNGAVTLDSTSVTSTGCAAVTVNPGSGITASQAASNTSAAENAAAARAAADAAALADTGVHSLAPLAVAVLALIAGGALLATRRHRTT
jgi:hypothetical protein